MTKAQIISFWVADGTGLAMDISRFDLQVTDATGEEVAVSSPLVVEAIMTQAVHDEILADVDYGQGSIMWSEDYETT